MVEYDGHNWLLSAALNKATGAKAPGHQYPQYWLNFRDQFSTD